MDQLNAPSVEGATAGDVAALGDAALAIFLDVDGTLLDLAARPEEVVTPAGLVSDAGARRTQARGALALISGRSIEDVDRLFAPLRLRASGVHGAEIRLDPNAPTTPTTAADLPQSLLAALRRAVEQFPGVFVENKRFSFTVHYRLAPSAERPLRNIVEAARGFDSDRCRHSWTRIARLRSRAPVSTKARAIAAFLSTSTFRGRTPDLHRRRYDR